MANQIVTFDLNTPNATGTDNVTKALRELLNSYPALDTDDVITFQLLEDTSGKAMFPTGNAAIISEKESITGHVTQQCVYSFMIVYRVSGTSENRKALIKEWLDNLGRWLEKQVVIIDGTEEKLESYPELLGNKKFKKISRTSQAYLYGTSENKSEDWAISLSATYQNEFDRD